MGTGEAARCEGTRREPARRGATRCAATDRQKQATNREGEPGQTRRSHLLQASGAACRCGHRSRPPAPLHAVRCTATRRRQLCALLLDATADRHCCVLCCLTMEIGGALQPGKLAHLSSAEWAAAHLALGAFLANLSHCGLELAHAFPTTNDEHGRQCGVHAQAPAEEPLCGGALRERWPDWKAVLNDLRVLQPHHPALT